MRENSSVITKAAAMLEIPYITLVTLPILSFWKDRLWKQPKCSPIEEWIKKNQAVLIWSWRKSPWRMFLPRHLLVKSLRGLFCSAKAGQPANDLVISVTLGEIWSPGPFGTSSPLFFVIALLRCISHIIQIHSFKILQFHGFQCIYWDVQYTPQWILDY